jgi:hypothetical protein
MPIFQDEYDYAYFIRYNMDIVEIDRKPTLILCMEMLLLINISIEQYDDHFLVTMKRRRHRN